VNTRILRINRNILWAELFVDELVRQGIKYACISPGSRSTPLVYALARHNSIKTLPHIDERAGSFFALGLAKRLQAPVVIACTSGTAAAEFYPAIIEAYQSQTPLIVVTADRPPELIDCGANQTIFQENMYANHINWYSNPGLPELTTERLLHIKTIARRAVAESNGFHKGPVHINMPFRKPFEPDTITDEIEEKSIEGLRQSIGDPLGNPGSSPDSSFITRIASVIKESTRGLFIVGPGYNDSAFSTAIIKLADILKYPILADGGSQLRHGKFDKSTVCTEYDAYLKVDAFAKMHTPDLIFQFGLGTSSKGLESFLSKVPTRRFHINPSGRWIDQSGYLDTVIRCEPSEFCRLLVDYFENRTLGKHSDEWLNAFNQAESVSSSVRQRLVDCTSDLFEGKVLRMVFDKIPDNSQVLVSNSMPIRDLDYFVSASDKSIDIFTNRGASGIDGITSTALGLAFNAGKPTVLVTGDLAFYHDMNGLLASLKFSIPLIVVLINNNGGGIFRMLPIADYPEVFTEYFITPHNLDFKPFISGYGGIYRKISNWSDFNAEFSDAINRNKLTVLDIPTDPVDSTKLRRTYWKEVEVEITKVLQGKQV
jgi:2-succinyl-5-enolpyruvyl-6-hydroxy-3-cyclohexene-1-carboxylate synthase